jgi:hypothetical protein
MIMNYIPYRIISLSPLASIPLGVAFLATGLARADDALWYIIAIQTATVIAAIVAHIMGVRRGMSHSMLISLLFILEVFYLLFVWGFLIDFSTEPSGLSGSL